MKLDVWEAVSSLLEAGGKFLVERYCLVNDKGHYHREDGPAVIYPNGNQFWCRDDGCPGKAGLLSLDGMASRAGIETASVTGMTDQLSSIQMVLSIGTAMACFIGMTGLLSPNEMVLSTGTGMAIVTG